MATEQEGSRNVLVVADDKSFLRDEIQLKKLQKKLNKESLDALDILIKIMTTTNDEKLKAQCAKDVLQFTVSVNKEISSDQIQRMVAEIRLGNGSNGKLIPAAEEEKPKRPQVDFTTIRSVE